MSFFFYFPETVLFFKSIGGSGRVSQGYGPGDISWVQMWSSVLYNKDPIGWLSRFYLSGPVALLLFWSAGRLYLRDRALFRFLCVMGLLPFFGSMLLYCQHKLWWVLPLLRSVDVSRVTWFTNIFLFAIVGIGIDELIKMRRAPDWLMKVGSIVVLVAISAGSVTKLLGFDSRVCDHGIGPTNSRYNTYETHFFQPREILDRLAPLSRIATDAPSYWGHDLRVSLHGFFGSNGRSLLQRSDFAKWLEDRKLIEVDQVPLAYHFIENNQFQLMSELGIRYFVTDHQGAPVRMSGWTLLATLPGKLVFPITRDDTSAIFIFENHLSTSVVSLRDDGRVTLPKFQPISNGLKVQLEPSQKGTLTVALLAQEGWSLYLDGQKQSYDVSPLGMFSVKLPGQNEKVKLVFEPVSKITVFLVAMAVMISVLLLHLMLMGRGKADAVHA